MMTRRIRPMRIMLVISLLTATLISGCGYTLQGRSDLPFDNISLGAIDNSTVEPKLQDRMSRLLAETLMEFGVDVRPSAANKISHFDLVPVSEKSLTAIEYQITVVGDFKLVDVKTQKSQPLLGISSPFITYFRSSGTLVSVLAQKEAATESALKDLSRELVRRMIYKQPAKAAITDVKKGEQKIEPQTIPAGK
jgi:outer membrane lipopolysaccharide assembly protein LptE/RlpB